MLAAILIQVAGEGGTLTRKIMMVRIAAIFIVSIFAQAQTADPAGLLPVTTTPICCWQLK